VAYIEEIPVGFCAVLSQPHPIAKGLKRCSRIVVMPDYQGVGIGTRLLDYCANYYKSKGYRFTIVTTTPALIYSFEKSPKWKLYRQGRVAATNTGFDGKRSREGNTSRNRLTTAWEYIT
jgi:GNAT superfamily N-acetyltransferase